MEEDQLSTLAITHLLQHTLRSLCIHENSHWIYAVFWRILPRNFPPPIWDLHGSGNRRNWILVWEDGFCNFAASSSSAASNSLQPELFFKMSHEIYNYGEGLVGKVASDYSHKWVYKEPPEQEINLISSWNNPIDSHPRTWEAQFQCGVKTIALVAVREGVVQLGAVNKVMQDLSFVVHLRKQFAYIESIPGVLLPHPSSSAVLTRSDGWDSQSFPVAMNSPSVPHTEFYNHVPITPSMSSLEALLSKLPSVGPPPPQLMAMPTMDLNGGEMPAKEQEESSTSMPYQ